MKRTLVLAGAAFLIAAPIAIAQTTTPPNQPENTTPAPTPPVTPPAATTTDPAPPTPMPSPSAPTAPTPSTGSASAPANDSPPQGCRTRKAAGEACACLSDTSRIGTSTPHPDGHNVCVRPE
ncbi:MAG: hypothetical protein ACT4OF_15045 [Caulobacteraceae bacterium]